MDCAPLAAAAARRATVASCSQWRALSTSMASRPPPPLPASSAPRPLTTCSARSCSRSSSTCGHLQCHSGVDKWTGKAVHCTFCTDVTELPCCPKL